MDKMIKIIIVGIMAVSLVFEASSKYMDSINASNEMIKNEINQNGINQNEIISTNSITLKDGLKDETLSLGVISIFNDQEKIDILDINIKGESNHVLVCKDSINDIVYYVNYGADNFIYRIKDGQSELVVELPAKRLFYRKDKLYFMLESYDTYTLVDMKDGNIFSYDPYSGKVSRIIDKEATMMFVYEEGIYYYVDSIGEELDDGTYTVNRNYYSYSFYTTKTQEITESSFLSLYKWNTKEIPRLCSFLRNKLYYSFDSKRISIYDIECNSRQDLEVMKDFTDFTLFNGSIITNELVHINLKTGIQSLILPKGENGEEIYELYTDGDYLYGLCGSSGIGDSVMKQIIIEKQKGQVITSKERTNKEYKMYRYVYYTKPLGKEA